MVFVLTVAHDGIRLGRKTYIIDIATPENRRDYISISNTCMGILLLVTGGLGSLLATISLSWSLGLLIIMGVLGIITSIRLPEADMTQ